MTGLIWTIQVLHYPAFAFIKDDQFTFFHQRHTRNITFIVVPIMTLEFLTSGALLVLSPREIFFRINFVLLICIWASTAFLSVPIHNRLSNSSNLVLMKKLVLTNWPRTILWSLRLIMLIAFFMVGLTGGQQ